MKLILLTGGDVALVDEEDFDYLMQWKWQLNRGYAVRAVRYKSPSGGWKCKSLYMHRVIMNAPEGMQVDHIWGNKLDNRKENLRLCTNTENVRNSFKYKTNTSGFKGVCWHKKAQKWCSRIEVNSKNIYLGLFTCPIEAAKAYNAAALKYFGEFARLNPIPGESNSTHPFVNDTPPIKK